MDLRSSRYVSCSGYVDLHPIKMTSPTCEDLGIPIDMGEEAGGVYPLLARRIIHSPSMHLEGLRYETDTHKITDPYSPLCMIPLPGALTLHTTTEPSFIRKRNERERERVRCVNEGYERLKEHLPMASKEKRISKVETLRSAIDYIRRLQKLLDDAPPLHTDSKLDDSSNEENSKEQVNSSKIEHGGHLRLQVPSDRKKRRCCSMSSEKSTLSDGTLSESEDEHCYMKRQ